MFYDSINFTPTLTGDLFSNRFNKIDKIFSTLTGETPISKIPNYDLIKTEKNQYELILNVPGYKEEELNISIENNQLNISGLYKTNKKNKKNIQYLHKGIKNTNFSIAFNLYKTIKINQAILKNGVLKIIFEYELPKEKQIQKINIQTS